MLPKRGGDAILVEANEELFAEDTGKGESDVAEENIGGETEVLVTISNVGVEGVCGVIGVSMGLAGALIGG